MKAGALTMQEIKKYIKDGIIRSQVKIPENNIQPASFDLRIKKGTAIRLPATFLPPTDSKILEFAEKISRENCLYDFNIKEDGIVLEVGVPYLLPIEESLELPKDVCAKANNKSSSGRVNLQVRLLAEGHQEFDTVPFGYKGPLFLLVIANSFPVKIKAGEVINQLRFFNGRINDAKLSYNELKEEHKKTGLVYDLKGNKKEWEDIRMTENGIILSANLKGKLVAYKFKGTATHGLDLTSRNSNPSDFFEPVTADPKGFIVLSKGGFYILSTNEAFSVPPYLCSEMVAYSVEAGEYRSHFAGFFDPGWGYINGKHGSAPAVLEIIAYEDMLLYHGQPVCAMTISHLTDLPEKMYGELGNHYHTQNGPRLSKHFAV